MSSRGRFLLNIRIIILQRKCRCKRFYLGWEDADQYFRGRIIAVSHYSTLETARIGISVAEAEMIPCYSTLDTARISISVAEAEQILCYSTLEITRISISGVESE